MWTWIETIGLRKFQEMLFTGRPFTAKEMYDANFINSVVERGKLDADTLTYASACSTSRPTDTGAVQKTLIELYPPPPGEYLCRLLTGKVESRLALAQQDRLAARTPDGAEEQRGGKG